MNYSTVNISDSKKQNINIPFYNHFIYKLSAIPDKSDPANGAAALAAKGNSIGSILPFC